MTITPGLFRERQIGPVTLEFRSQGEELIYCFPDKQMLDRPGRVEAAAGLNAEPLYSV